MNWKIGTKLIMVKNGRWFWPQTNETYTGPAMGDIVTFDGTDGLGYIFLREWVGVQPDGSKLSYSSDPFRPLLGESARTELIGSFVEVTETSDCPINVPEKETA